MGCPMGYGYGSHKHWGGSMMQSWRDDQGGRMVMGHMWVMMVCAWMMFMLGMMIGAKRAMMMSRMRMMGMGPMAAGGMGMAGMGGYGMGKCGPGMMHHHHGGMMHHHMGAMKAHHHHGGDAMPCCEKHEGGEGQQGEGGQGEGGQGWNPSI